MIDPLDKSTVVSLFPLPIIEEKPGIYPGRFEIAAAGKDPALLTVGQSIYYVDVGEDRPQLEVFQPSMQVARSIVEDFIAAQLGYNLETGIGPGLTWMRGDISLLELKTKHAGTLDALRKKHKLWNIELVKLADDDWQRYHNHKVISEIQRIAARAQGFTNRDWLIIPEQLKSENCPACGQAVTPNVVVCPNCRCILDKEKYDTMAFAK